MDPLAEIYHFQTPYAYAANNPVRFIDWMGMGPTLGEMWDMAGNGNAKFNFDNGEVTDWYTWNVDDEGDMNITSWGGWDDDTDDFTVTFTDSENIAIGENPYLGMFAESKIGEHYIRNYINAQGQGGGFNIWGDISNSFLVGAAANQPTYFRSSQIAKEGKFAVDGWKTYSNAFKGNQYVSSASVKEAKAAFNSVAKTTSRISTGLTLVSFGVTYANYAAGNVSDGRYYVQQTINAIGLFGPWGAGIAIGLGTVDAIWGDQIEGWIRE